MATLIAACVDEREGSAVEPLASQRPNVILIVVDTLRADHLGSYGYPRPTSPHIDALAEDAIVYEQALSQAPWTTPSIGSLLSSLYPSTLGIKGNQSVLADEPLLLSEILQQRGFVTGAVVSHSFCSSRWNFDQGFQEFDESNVSGNLAVTSPEVTDRGLDFVARHAAKPFFLWLHYFDPHVAYVDHPAMAFPANPDYVGRVHSGQDFKTLRRFEGSLTEAELDEMRRLYDSEVAFTDAAIGRFLRELKDQGLYENSVIIFTADHGEEFLEHGRLGHAKTVYHELIHVPLIIKLPGVAPQRIDTPVALLDVYPSVLDFLGIDAPPHIEGRSLLPEALGGQEGRGETRPIFSETWRGSGWQSVTVGERKLHVNRQDGKRELYDLSSDPGEQRDQSEAAEQELARLEGILASWARRDSRALSDAPTVELSKEERVRLEALGYGE
jgi:arylsulfatase A-like enzyme